MFTQDTLDFLRDLEADNDRAWFTANKARHDTAVKAPAAEYIDRMCAELERRTGLAHRGKLFRIHRDVRFSKDKTPYNTHVHISLSPVVAAGLSPAWMMGLAPGYFTLGCGAFGFDKEGLIGFRDGIAAPGGEAIAAIPDRLAAAGIRFDAPELKRVPAPYPRDHPRGALLRRKGLAGWIDGAAPDGLGEAGFDHALEGFDRLRPLFDLMRHL